MGSNENETAHIDKTNTVFLLDKALIVHITSYVNKAIINLGVDLDVIPDPHHLCDHIVEALQIMKSAVEEEISGDLGV